MQNGDSLNWEKGCWENGQASETQAEVSIVSDWAPIRAFNELMIDTPEKVYGDLLPILRESDLRIANLECPLTQTDAPVWKSGTVLKGGPEHIKALDAPPFEVVTLGNNHVFDHGTAAFEETLGLLDDHGIKTVGAGMTAKAAKSPLVVDVNDIRLAIISFSEGEDLTASENGPGVFGWEVDRVIGLTGQLKQAVDFILVVCHGGVEYIPFPPPYLAEAFQRIVDAGADLVIGHHPHVPQGIQVYKNTPICYSLGNFVFYQETDLLFRKIGYFVKVGIAKNAVARLQLIPYGIHRNGLRLLKNEKLNGFLQSLKAVSDPLHDVNNIEKAWHAFLKYNGADGLRAELRMILDRMISEPQKGAAMLRNRVTTLQHSRQWIDALTRIIDGRIDESPAWASELTEKWLTEKIPAQW